MALRREAAKFGALFRLRKWMLMQASPHSSRSGLRRSGIHNRQALEAGSIETTVASQQSVSLRKGMCSDKKIRRHACPGATPLAIGLPGEACLESCLRLDRAELDLQFSERVAAGRNRWKAARNLGPHHVADEQGPLPSTGAQRISGSGPELGIVIQYCPIIS